MKWALLFVFGIALGACSPSAEELEKTTEANCRAPFRELSQAYVSVTITPHLNGRITYGGIQRGSYESFQFKGAPGIFGSGLKIRSDYHLTIAYWQASASLAYYIVEAHSDPNFRPQKHVAVQVGQPVGVQENVTIRCPDESDLRLARLLEDMYQQVERLDNGADLQLMEAPR